MRRIACRVILITLVCSMILITSVSCSHPESTDIEPIPDYTVKIENKINFADADYTGQQFVFLTYDENQLDYSDNYIWNEEDNSDPVKKAVMERNAAVKEKYGIEIQKFMCQTPAGVSLQKIKAGICDFDVVYDWGIRLTNNAVEGLYYDISQLDNINTENSYWAPETIDDLTIAGKQFIFTNDITMNRTSWAFLYFFNKDLIKKYNLTMPYDYVYRNEWTVDNFLSLILAVSDDINNDKIYDENDVYGILGSPGELMCDFYSYAGNYNTVKTDNGYSLNIYNQTISQIFSKFNNILSDTNAFGNIKSFTSNAVTSEYQSIHKAERRLSFGSGHVLFANYTMDIAYEFMDMRDDFGIVPNPKYTKDQEEYYHWIDCSASMFALPLIQNDPQRTGIILEYLAYESEQKLTPAFYSSVIDTKNESAEDDAYMLDIVRNSAHYEWTSLYYLIFKNKTDIFKKLKIDMFASGQISSVYNRYKESYLDEVNDIYKKIAKITFDD